MNFLVKSVALDQPQHHRLLHLLVLHLANMTKNILLPLFYQDDSAAPPCSVSDTLLFLYPA